MPFVIKKVSVPQFLGLGGLTPVIDVRSPGEYSSGHIPDAVNILLFDDSQRTEVGTVYKNEGSIKAVLRGIDLTGPLMSAKLIQGLDFAVQKSLLLYCWRGGMRSEAMAWLFSMGEITSVLLEGGYKAYRKYILADLGKKRNLIILGGMTGSGKTHIIRHMMSAGTQVTDLEALASHKGSAFGALGQAPQPTSEHFANLLYYDLSRKKDDDLIWLEDESRNIGSVFMPDTFYDRMQEAPVIVLMMSIETRMTRLLNEYAAFPPEQLTASLMKISKRLGGNKTREALRAINIGDFRTAIKIILEYYDKSYSYGLSKRREGQIIYIETDTDDVAVNASKVAEAAESLR